MTWIKLDDQAIDHPKIAGLPYRAFHTWIRGLCYASRFLTDGVLPLAFLATVRNTERVRLIGAGLWIYTHDDNTVRIHDYLEHQTAKETVEKERQRNRDRRRAGTGGTPTGTPAGTPAGRTDGVPRPEAEAEVEADVHTKKEQRSSSLIVSPEYYEKRKRHCAFVGSKIEVPNGLHAELRKNHGGHDPELELQDWYLTLNEQAETGEWRIPQSKNFYPWFKALYARQFPPPSVNGAKSVDEEIEEWARS